MELMEIKDKRRLRREAAASELRRLADELERHNGLTLTRAGREIVVRVPDEVEFELEVEVEGDGGSVEIELTW